MGIVRARDDSCNNAAQYGSDTIAGVMNFELKNARSGGSLEIRSGRRYDENDGDRSSCGPLGRSCNGIGGYGVGYSVAGNVGLPFAAEGFLSLSFQYGAANGRCCMEYPVGVGRFGPHFS